MTELVVNFRFHYHY